MIRLISETHGALAPAEADGARSPGTYASGAAIAVLLFKLYALVVLVCAIGRLGLMSWQYDRLQDLGLVQQWMALVHGLRFDTMAAGFWLLPVALVLCLWPGGRLTVTVARSARGWMMLGVLLFVFMEAATFPFFAEYDVRPNHLFIEYLRYPQEIGSMLWKDQKAALAIAVLLLVGTLWALRRFKAFTAVESTLRAPLRTRAVWLLPLLFVLGMGIRSSLGHRPANLSDALYSNNRVANELAKNSAYSVARAAMQAAKGRHLAQRYGAMSEQEAFVRVHRLLGMQTNGSHALRRVLEPVQPLTKPRNLVLIIEESLGAQFVGFTDGRRDLTPHIDALSRESLSFTHLYSNGTRSVRGLSAMSAGFQAVPGEDVIKRYESQSGFFTIAALLKPLGYHTSFIYGGEGRFDNMKAWYLGNGFEEVIEQKDYPQPRFVSTWGVSDEDLLLKAHERFQAHAEQGRPFVSVVFTSSNHTPFELPENTIQWTPGVEKRSVENAIKYADYALGKFFEAAKQSTYYDNTVFVVAADHNVRVYGDDVVPVAGFHIPALIHVPGAAPRKYDGLISQPDVLATALSYLGIPLQVPILGNPVNVRHEPFVLMQFNDTYGFRRGNRLAVLRPDKPPATYIIGGDEHLRPTRSDLELERDGLALIHATEVLVESADYH